MYNFLKNLFTKRRPIVSEKSESEIFFFKNLVTSMIKIKTGKSKEINTNEFVDDLNKYFFLLMKEDKSDKEIIDNIILNFLLPDEVATQMVNTSRSIFNSQKDNFGSIDESMKEFNYIGNEGSGRAATDIIETLVDLKVMGETDEQILKRISDIGFDNSTASSLLFMIRNAAEAKTNLNRINKSKF